MSVALTPSDTRSGAIPECLLICRPLVVNWNFTYDCNFNCLHCYSRNLVTTELSTADAKTVGHKLAKSGILLINFGGGESLIRKDFFEVAQYIHDLGVQVSLSSNGSLIDKVMSQRLASIGVHSVGISLDSHDATVHNNFRNTPRSFERAIAAIRALREEGITVSLLTVISRLNYRTFPELVELADELDVASIQVHDYKISGRAAMNRNRLDLMPDEWHQFYIGLTALERSSQVQIAISDPLYALVNSRKREEAIKGCNCGKTVFTLTPNGTIILCPFRRIEFGNILEVDLETLWQSPGYLQMIYERPCPRECHDCKFWDICQGGCRARCKGADGPDIHCWITFGQNRIGNCRE